MDFKKYFLLVFLLVVSGCDADLLNLVPKTSITEANFYNNQEEIQQAVDDVYRQLGTNVASARSVVDLYGELFSDNTSIIYQLVGTDDTPISRHQIRASNSRIADAWSNSYSTIYTINNLLERLENTKVELDENLENRWIAEITLIRSLTYFNLVRAFGDIPLVLEKITTEEAYNYLREDTDIVYEQIVNDLRFAKEILPEEYSGSDVGRVTKYAAAAILAKVYLTIGDEESAQSELEFIINNGRFSLDANNDGIINEQDYRNNFLPHTKNNRESILEAQYKAGINGVNSNHQTAYMPYNWAFNLPGAENKPFRGGGGILQVMI